MSLRTWMVLGSLATAISTSLYIINNEEITKSEAELREDQKKTDPHHDMKYIASERLKNFQAFGMDEAMAKRTVDRIDKLDQERLYSFLRNADESSAMADALCGSTRQRRPRYGALEFLVEPEGDKRQTVSLLKISSLKRQEWTRTSPIQRVYEAADLARPPEPDSTLMAMAAIFTRNEDTLLAGNSPWGATTLSRWSWEKVKEKNAGIEERLVEYFALMHLTIELAKGDGGICE
jgi:soluble cytochrome b562